MWRALRIAAAVGPVALLLAVGASAIAGSATSDRRPCPTHGSFSRNLIAVVAVSPRVVVETLAFHPYQPYRQLSFACYPPTRRRTFLGDDPIVLGNGVSRPRIVLKPHGTLAWSQAHEVLVCRRACITQDPTLPAGQHVQTRAHSQGIDARSLRATPRGIEWREDGRWRRARL